MTTSVFVAGASGFIGQGVAIAMRRAGYKVYGLVRSKEKGAFLLANEVIPVVGDLDNADTYTSIVEKSDVIIDATNPKSSADYFAHNRLLLQVTRKFAEVQYPHRIKTFVYTSGIMVYGDSQEVRDETSPFNNEHPLFKAKTVFEAEVLTQEKVRGIVIRPGWLYGGTGSYSGHYFSANEKTEKLIIRGNKDKRYSWIHIDDLTSAYVLVVQAGGRLKGEVFNIVERNNKPPTFEGLSLKGAAIAGFKGTVEYAEPHKSDYYSTDVNRTVILNPQKAIDLLGWTPRHIGLVDELEIYYLSYLAGQGKQQ